MATVLGCVPASERCALLVLALGVATYAMHDDSVWALRPNKEFTMVYTGGTNPTLSA